MSGSKQPFRLSQLADPAADIVLEKKDLIAEPPAPPADAAPVVVMPEQGREAPAESNGDSDGAAIMALAEQFRQPEGKRQTTVRLPPWLDNALNTKYYELRMKGFRKITKEAIVMDALSKYFGLTPPAE
jgi:hypothetical protein